MKDKCVVALADGIYEYSFVTKTFNKKAQILKDNTLNRLNDGKCAPDGAFWVGSMHNTAEKPTAALYSITSNFEVTKQVENITVSNGIAWSLDGTKMYYIDTPTQKVVQYDYSQGKFQTLRIL
ncbi:MAG: SMP-30/gluconolactonase/LRE family protein [Bacteroidales bacterium]|nr:SMP-30/gluconolactonase/LRE family protein [Bacteroidales bacterium]